MTIADFGREFLNTKPELSPGAPGTVVNLTAGASILPTSPFNLPEARFAAQNAVILQLSINILKARGGGYLYFPPGRYYLGRSALRPLAGIVSEEHADIVVPPEVTLWFAPAAVLVPLAGAAWVAPRPIPGLFASDPENLAVRLEIQGDIVAGVEPIFDAQLDEQDGTFGVSVGVPAGRILLTGHQIRKVYPEWWGALPRLPVSDEEAALAVPRTARALQATIDAAYTRRTSPRRMANGQLAPGAEWNVRPSIPIEAASTYVIDRELRVRSPTDRAVYPWFGGSPLGGGGFELQGERGMGHFGAGAPSIIASTYPSARFPTVGSMLDIDGPEHVRIEGLILDGALQATCALKLAPSRTDWLVHRIEGCTFRSCVGALVTLDARAASGNHTDYWNVSFTRCRFDPGSEDIVTPRLIAGPAWRTIPDAEYNLVGVDVILEDNGGLVFQNCMFSGHASPAIRARSGRFSLNESCLHVIRAGHPALPEAHRGENFRHGMDIYIEPEGARSFHDRYVPATFTAREVESQSWQFLGTSQVEVPTRDFATRSAVILLNVHHSPVANRDVAFNTLDEEIPPSIFWGQPGQLGCPLVMIGSTLRGIGPDAARMTGTFRTRPVVIVGPNVAGDIFQIGCHLFITVVPGFNEFVMPLRPDIIGPQPPFVIRTLRRLTAQGLPP